MASPEKIVPSLPLPDTLPEDFGEWDGEDSPADSPAYSWEREAPSAAPPVYTWESQTPATAERVESDEWALWAASHSSSKTPKPLGQSAERKATLSSITDKPHVSDSVSSTPVSVEPQKGFADRDSDAPSAAKHVDADEWAVWAAAHSSRKTPKPLGQSTERQATSSSVVDRPHVSDAGSSAPIAVKPQERTSESVDGSTSRASRRLEASHAAHVLPAASDRPNLAIADEALFEMFSATTFEVKEERKVFGKKWMIVAAVSAGSVLLLLLLMIPLFHHGAKSAAKQSAQPLPVATDTQLQPDKSKPSAGEPLTQDKAPATTATQQATDNQPASKGDETDAAQTPTETQTQMMNDQLNAPTKIPQGIKTQVAENEPPAASFGTAGADGLGGSSANASIFNGRPQAVVKAAPAKPIAISSGVAVGMLIYKTTPIYPTIAKTARVSGTVELAATISRTGTIKDLHVVNGPVMLRQAAADAVRTWRYQPYKLNNEPTDVETTINVVFSLGG